MHTEILIANLFNQKSFEKFSARDSRHFLILINRLIIKYKKCLLRFFRVGIIAMRTSRKLFNDFHEMFIVNDDLPTDGLIEISKKCAWYFTSLRVKISTLWKCAGTCFIATHTTVNNSIRFSRIFKGEGRLYHRWK